MPERTKMICVNHVGFLPQAFKSCVVVEPPEPDFEIFELRDTLWNTAYRGTLTKGGTELASGWMGDFSALTQPGIYQVRCGHLRSRCFVIDQSVYDVPQRVVFNYFPWQRCGESVTGWHAPCHLEDGRIVDTGERLDLVGGYHQSGDLRKWACFVNMGLIGLAATGLLASPRWDDGQIAEEITWGCDYYQKLITPEGSLLDSVFIPLGWGARDYYRSPAPAPAHWNTIRQQALAARYFADRDPQYAARCREAAQRIWNYMTSSQRPTDLYQAPALPPRGHDGFNSWFSGFYPGSALDLAHRLCAALSLYRVTNTAELLADAARSATALASLQVGSQNAEECPGAACFWEGPQSAQLVNSAFYFWHISGPVGLCELLAFQPNHPDAGIWRNCIHRIAAQYLWTSQRNPWGRVPARWYSSAGSEIEDCFSFSTTDPQSAGRYPAGAIPVPAGQTPALSCDYAYYPFAYHLDLMGIAHFLRSAAALTGEQQYADLAQRQLDWIMGCNPWDASAIEGVGYNQPQRGIFGEFFPPTPQIPGAVTVGFTPHSFEPESYGLDNEYDMPVVGWTLWLLSEVATAGRAIRAAQ